VKRTTTIFFLFFYFTLTVGITEAIHFCGEKIAYVRLLPIASQKGSCGCDDAMTPDDCCKIEIKLIQLNDDQLNVQTDQVTSPQTDVTIWINEPAAPLYASESIQQALPTDSPPVSTPSYILQHAFRI